MVRDANAATRRISSGQFPFWYRALLVAASLWTLFNCAYVYLALDGARTYRIESAAILFVAFLLPATLIRSSAERRVELPPPALWAIAIAGAAAWLAIMAPRVTYPFLSDDYVFLERYENWSDIWRVQPLFRPLFATVFWLTAETGGGSTVPFHVLALSLHVACAVLVGVLARRILESRTAAILAFAVFLVDPLQLEATLWISGLQELLCAVFVLSAAVVYSRGNATATRAFLATPFIILALLSKETAIGYLLLFPIVDAVLGRIAPTRKVAQTYLALAAVAAAYAIVRSRFTLPDRDFLSPPTRYFFKQFVTLPYRFFVQPWNAEAVDAPLSISFVLCAAILALLLTAALSRRLSRVSLAGPFVVIAFSLPLYRYFFVAPDLMAARYLYLPFVGWTLLLLDALTSTVRRPLVATLIVVLIVTGSAVALRLNLRPWNTAAEAVAVMESAVQRGSDPLAALRSWERGRSIQLLRRGGVPSEYQGVYIFRNGYDEFVRFASGRAAGSP
jgi:hypothetical protein